jgi:hypothetical protein
MSHNVRNLIDSEGRNLKMCPVRSCFAFRRPIWHTHTVCPHCGGELVRYRELDELQRLKAGEATLPLSEQ